MINKMRILFSFILLSFSLPIFCKEAPKKIESLVLTKPEKKSPQKKKSPPKKNEAPKPKPEPIAVIEEEELASIIHPAEIIPTIELEEGHLINFPNVSMYELVKFVSRLAGVNFIGDQSLLDYEVSFISGAASKPSDILDVLVRMLKQKGLAIEKLGNYFIIKEKSEEDLLKEDLAVEIPKMVHREGKFFVYKLQYHQGSEILTALKQISADTASLGNGDENMSSTIASMQWIQSTNSLFFTGPQKAITKVCDLIKSLDTALKQVFIEVLVIETNISNSLDFGLQWSMSSKYKDRVGFGASSLYPSVDNTFADSMKSVGSSVVPEGLKQFPVGNGFDLGIIGDIIFHKGKSFLSLGSLVSALQTEGHCSIVLNQKIITQENKNSRIFVGDNVPFAGSVVQTIGSGQQTTANIEYRDVGVSLNITPLLGDSEIITLDISEEITEALDHPMHKTNQLSGIKTSKTNMATSVHVPNGHFLILSGMTRSVKTNENRGPPCLGAIPFIGGLFNKKDKKDEKTNILIFVRPHIINSSDEYIDLSNDLNETYIALD